MNRGGGDDVHPDQVPISVHRSSRGNTADREICAHAGCPVGPGSPNGLGDEAGHSGFIGEVLCSTLEEAVDEGPDEEVDTEGAHVQLERIATVMVPVVQSNGETAGMMSPTGQRWWQVAGAEHWRVSRAAMQEKRESAS